MKNRHYPIKASDFIKEIEPHILKYYKRTGRPTGISHYHFFSAVLYVLRTGIPWRDVPTFYGHWHTIYTRFKRWSENGLFWHLLYLLQKKKKISLDCVWIDSTTVSLHRPGSGSLKKRSSVDRARS
ncbi:transposase [Candidatus Regiella insecticola]|uniref:transposase n=1 Tax=Candidatus Regiella insecticola TaxID=138073 RepID=UPI000906E472|nr:transposase [Candidatus Regiella insecticola]